MIYDDFVKKGLDTACQLAAARDCDNCMLQARKMAFRFDGGNGALWPSEPVPCFAQPASCKSVLQPNFSNVHAFDAQTRVKSLGVKCKQDVGQFLF
jgi:hypothetical protein